MDNLLYSGAVIVALSIFASTGGAADAGFSMPFSMPAEGTSEAIPAAPQGPERIIGGYTAGCILGASAFPESTAYFELVNTVRNHQYGHSSLLKFVQELGTHSVRMGWGKLRVGDSSCPCGGKMGVGHSSHRIGLDVDIFFKSVPANMALGFQERNSWDEKAQQNADIARWEQPEEGAGQVQSELTGEFKAEYMDLLKKAALMNEVDRIFISPPIKRKLCDLFYNKDSVPMENWQWLKKVRPWTGHKSHFHARLKCPKTQTECIAQAPIPEDATDKSLVGCEGKEFAAWFLPKPKVVGDAVKNKPEKPAAPPTAAEKKCATEIEKLKIFSPSPEVRCLIEPAQEIARCRNYRTTETYSKRTPSRSVKPFESVQ
jgi:penicillin-insensitive murein endopeptidase